MIPDDVLADLDKRGLKVSSFIATDNDGKLQLISYDANGCANFIRKDLTNMQIFENQPGGGMIAVASVGDK